MHLTYKQFGLEPCMYCIYIIYRPDPNLNALPQTAEN